MIRKYFLLTILAWSFSFINAQDFQSYYSVSAYGGIQNPKEIILINFTSRSPVDHFKPGAIMGLSLNKDWKRLALSLHLDYMHNSMNNSDWLGENKNMHNFAISSKLWFNFLKPSSKMRLKAGVGLTSINSRYTLINPLEREIDNIHIESHNIRYRAYGISSGLNFTYAINDKISLSTIINTSLIPYYGNLESVLQSSVSIGANYRLQRKTKTN